MASIVLRVLEQMNSRTLRCTALRLSSQRTPAGGLGRRQLRSAAPPSHNKEPYWDANLQPCGCRQSRQD
jgi:hypothetical protein